MTARQELIFQTPWLNAAGFCGFTPGNGWNLAEPQGMFFTNPVTMKPRPFSSSDRIQATPGGFIFNSSSPNPGLGRLLKTNAAAWRSSRIPVCMHIRPEDAGQPGEMARLIEDSGCAAAIELECPHEASEEEMRDFWQTVSGELPLIAAHPLGTVHARMVEMAISAGVDAVSLTTPFGLIQDKDGRFHHGRLFGPALLPQVLQDVHDLKGCGLPVIAGCGLFRKADAEAALAAGAAAVQMDAVLWRPGGWVETRL